MTALRSASALLLLAAPALAAGPEAFQALDPPGKVPASAGVPDPRPQAAGEDIATAIAIGALPFQAVGNTCGFLDDYDEVCPWSGSTSPDVVYSFLPGADVVIDALLCNSAYDTKIYIYENDPANRIACRDDICGADGFQADVLGVPLTAGNTYYIVVDGFAGDCGDYVLDVRVNVPCVLACPPGASPEGEPDCADDYVDTFNGGCNSEPNVFSKLPCVSGTYEVCGRYGGYFDTASGLDFRDTDWYQLDVPAGGLAGVSVCIQGEDLTLLGYVDGNLGCADPTLADFVHLRDCETGCLTLDLPPGPAWIFVATDVFGPAVGCGGDYVLTVSGLPCTVDVDDTSWGEVKAGWSR